MFQLAVLDVKKMADELAEYLAPMNIPRCTSSVVIPNVVSKIASYFIFLASLTSPNPIPVEQGIQAWQSQTQGPLRDIFRHVRKKHEGNVKYQAIQFALLTAQFIRTGSWNARDIPLVTCPYVKSSENFIRTLVETHSCQCSCYSFYVAAAAEEFGYSAYLSVCMVEAREHLTLVLVDPKETADVTLPGDEEIWARNFVQREPNAEIKRLIEPTSYTFLGSKILAKLELAIQADMIPFYVEVVGDEEDVHSWRALFGANYEYVSVSVASACLMPFVTNWTMFCKLFFESLRNIFVEKRGMVVAMYILGCLFDVVPFIDLIVKDKLLRHRLVLAEHYKSLRELVPRIKQEVAENELAMVKFMVLATHGLESQKLLMMIFLDLLPRIKIDTL